MTAFGRPHRHYRVTDSTNDRARELAHAGAPGGTVVTADEQTAGKGRRGRTWAAPPGKALLYSAILRPLDRGQALLPLAAPVAVCEAIESVAAVRCAIKWPNDIWVDERKVAGILIEARPPEWGVIGVGINVAVKPDELPADVRWPPAALGAEVDVDGLRSALDAALSAWVGAGPEEALAAYRGRDALRGRRVSWEEGGGTRSGSAEGVDDDGNLVVVLAAGERVAVGSGEVSVRVG